MVYYHLDQVVITCFCRLPDEIRSALKTPDRTVTFYVPKGKGSSIKTEGHTRITLSDPSREFFLKTFDLLHNIPHALSRIEIACDTTFQFKCLAEEMLEKIEKTMYRKHVIKFIPYKKDIKRKTLSLYFGRRPYQLAVYVREYKGHFCLRQELRICHQNIIKKTIGVEGLVGLILNFDFKNIFDEWYDKYMVEGVIDFKKAVRCFYSFPAGPRQRMRQSLAERHLISAYTPATFRADIDKILKDIKRKHGRKSKRELKLRHRSPSDFVKPK